MDQNVSQTGYQIIWYLQTNDAIIIIPKWFSMDIWRQFPISSNSCSIRNYWSMFYKKIVFQNIVSFNALCHVMPFLCNLWNFQISEWILFLHQIVFSAWAYSTKFWQQNIHFVFVLNLLCIFLWNLKIRFMLTLFKINATWFYIYNANTFDNN